MIDQAALLTAYALTPPLAEFPVKSGVNNSIIGLHTGAGDFVLKTFAVHNDLAMLKYEHTLLAWLATQPLSFAVPAPVPTTTGEFLLATPAGYQLLLPFLSGQTPVCTDATQVEAIGVALAELHRVLVHYPTHARPGMAPFGNLAAIHSHLPDPYSFTPAQVGLPETAENEALLAWWRTTVAALRPFIDGTFAQLPRQVIHGDYSPSNILYAAGRIRAILDFEFAGPDARAMDLANGLIFTMRLWENPTPLVNAAAFARGYGSRQRLTATEIAALPSLMRVFYATASVWWLGRDPQHQGLEHLYDMRQLDQWLDEHATALVQTVGLELQ